MKIGVMSDIHGNPEALREVLADMDREGVDEIVCCGDVVGYGPDPLGAIELLRARGIPVVMGNHDAAVAGLIGTANFIDDARRGVRRHRRQLKAEDLQWLKELPYLYNGDGFACAHGEFGDPEAFNYILRDRDSMPSFLERKEPVLFVGHTHLHTAYAWTGAQAIEMPEDALAFRVPGDLRFVVNVGSVGYPRNEPYSTYVTYDTERHIVQFHRLPFNFNGYVEQLRKRRIRQPGWLPAALEFVGRKGPAHSVDFSR